MAIARTITEGDCCEVSRTANSEAIEKMEDEVQSSWETGFWDGVESANKPIPDWFFTKKLSMLKAYESGYFTGRQVEIAMMRLG